MHGKIFVSYLEEINEDCWNTSIIYGNVNYEVIEFKKIFFNKDKECVHSINNVDGEFNPYSSGGRMISFDENHILFQLGNI